MSKPERRRVSSTPHAGVGGSPNASGTMESGVRNVVANRAGRSRLRWRAVRTTLARTCWVSAPRWVARAPVAHFVNRLVFCVIRPTTAACFPDQDAVVGSGSS